MTACLVSLALVLNHTPIEEVPQWNVSDVNYVTVPAASFATSPSMSQWVEPPWFAETLPNVSLEPSPTSESIEPEPPPELAWAPTDRELVDSIFGWPGAQLVQCESRWDRWAVGRAGERGLFQIHPVHKGLIASMGYTWDEMFDAEPNIRVAVEIRRRQGLRAWTCWHASR
jgi:hypothetical protein